MCTINDMTFRAQSCIFLSAMKWNYSRQANLTTKLYICRIDVTSAGTDNPLAVRLKYAQFRAVCNHLAPYWRKETKCLTQ